MSTDEPTGTLHAETLRALSREALSELGHIPALTILAHPDPDRIGDRAICPELLEGADVALSRSELQFANPKTLESAPLSDRYLSRRPLMLNGADGAVRIDPTKTSTELSVDGVAHTTPTAALALADELVLTLSDRVALLLHAVPLPQLADSDHGLVGESAPMAQVRAAIGRVADLAVPVLLRGESGTGKELVARAIHVKSPRAGRPMHVVNMAAMTPSTAASELFGHVKGAFTGAQRDHDGYFLRSHGGTLFLDEVGATPFEIQAMLLRVLESGEIQPVGGRGSRRVDVRLVAATDARLEQAIADGTFRLPLLHRLAGYEITLPPLRNRREDIPRLLVHFLRTELEVIGEKHRLAAAPAEAKPWLPAALVERLVRYGWPGNVRQLRNVARQLVISSRGLPRLLVDPSVERLLAEVPRPAAPPAKASHAPPASGRARKPEDIPEKELMAALQANGWRVRSTATALGLAPATLYSLIDRSPNIRRARDIDRGELDACGTACSWDLDQMSTELKVSKRSLKQRLKLLGLV